MEQDVTNITLLGLLFIMCLGLLILTLPRRYAVVPILISACYMTLGQVLVIGGLHFTIYRIFLILGLIRILGRKEIYSIKINKIDKILIAWISVSTCLYIGVRGLSAVFDSNTGLAYGLLLNYILFRAIIRDIEDVIRTVELLAVIIIPLAVFFIYEMETGKNIFSALGGVQELSEIRDGRVRCQGPFRHPILAGTFGATTFPLFIGLWKCQTRKRYLTASAILVTAIIVITSASSGALLAYLAGTVGLGCWHFKSHMRIIRWGIVVMLLSLHAVMKAPVWFLIARVSDLVGGGGYHRSALIDAAIHHFSEWWLLGTTYTAHWMPYGITADPNNVDLTNQFIVEGVRGGVLSMGLFVWLIANLFKVVGIASNNMYENSDRRRFMIWSLGCVVFSHVVSMFSITYFDQTIMFWCLIIAMIAVCILNSHARQKYYGRNVHLSR
jgi:hypothetical protein